MKKRNKLAALITAAAMTVGLVMSALNVSAESEKVLKVATNWEKASFDYAQWSDASGCKVGTAIYETLLTLDENKEIQPYLAESYEVSEDYKTYTFHLRQGVQFHAGYGEMTSEDVAYSLERLSDPDVGAVTAPEKAKVSNIESMDTSDPYTFVLNLKEPDVNVLMDFASWYTFVTSKKAGEELGTGLGQTPVGTGAFEYESGKIAESYTVKKFEDYWGETAKVDKITVTLLADEINAVNAFDAGEIDITGLSDANNIKKYQDSEVGTLTQISDNQNYYLGMNCTDEILSNKEVRQALSYAINYEELIDAYFQGNQKLPSGYVPSDCMYSKATLTPTYDPEKCKEMLAEAGYPDGFTVTCSAVNDTMSKGPLMVIQQYLAAVGVNMELDLAEYATYIEKVRAGEAQMWFMINGDGFMGSDWLPCFASDQAPGRNWDMYQNPEYDECLENAEATADLEEKTEWYGKAQDILTEDMPSIVCAEYMSTTLTRNTVTNVERDVRNYIKWNLVDITE
ncbi:MAG: ABC transporter substrate-binding protein [Eubacteriales bacterium]|nr:ABC transporter substrate-binding protein [Eubacteriales bacterium]